MSDEKKARPGLFRLKDLEALELEEQPLFPTSEGDDRPGLVSEVAAGEMVAAIRRARDLHSQEHEPEDLSPEVSGVHSLIMESPPAGLPALEDDLDATGEHDLQAFAQEIIRAEAEAPSEEPKREYRTAQAHAVIQAAEAVRVKRSTGALLLMVGIPLILAAVTAAIVIVVLFTEPPMTDASFPVRALTVSVSSSELAAFDLMAPPEPEPEPEPAAEPERDEREERRERRERRRREREREPEIDRSDLF